MKKKTIIMIVLIAILLLFIYILNYNSVENKISRDLGVDMPNVLKFKYTDSHSFFKGDGITQAKTELSDKQIKKIIDSSDDKWRKTPMPQEIKSLVYAREFYTEGEESLTKDTSITSIENGYWIFKDRTSKEVKEKFPNVRSSNYSVGIIDLDNNIFYYVKYDS